MLKKFFSILLIVFTVCSFASQAQAYTKPGDPSGFVNDFAGVLSADQKSQLESKLSDFEKTTSEEIAVAIVPDLGGDTVENYAVHLFEDWKIGKADRDTGVLFLIAINDHKMRIEVGYGLEGDLTDIQSRDILDNIVAPEFKNNNYFAGIDKGTDQIITELKNGTEVQRVTPAKTSSGGSSDNNYFVILWILFVFFSVLSRVLARSKSWYGGGIIGGIAAVIIGLIKGFAVAGLIAAIVLIPLGLIFDYIVSKRGPRPPGKGGGFFPWIIGGGGGGSSGGGFGGFGGGSSGGGGSSSSW